MCPPTRIEVLRLYKNLMRYGQGLKYTDKDYYYNRIRMEFLKNKEAKEEELDYMYKVGLQIIRNKRPESIGTKKGCLNCLIDAGTCFVLKIVSLLLGLMKSSLLGTAQNYCAIRLKIVYDRSKVPTLDENDLEESFIKGSGPGGQNVNKRSSCVSILHKPTGIVVKCQELRDREQNRKLARERLITKLDNLYNGEDSIENQKKRIQQKRSNDKKRKRRKLLELRQFYKEKDKDNKSDKATEN